MDRKSRPRTPSPDGDVRVTSVAIIGAGCSGFTTAKKLQDAGITATVFEASDRIGGNWAYGNPNGKSACYQSLHIDTSKTRLQFEDYPVPQGWPDFPHHSLLNGYFNDYVDHFDLRELIRFNTAVERADRIEGQRWRLHLSTGDAEEFDVLVVANGHHWSPNMPQWPGSFDGDMIHSHEYRTPFQPVDMIGKRVLVVGLGNSAVDIASELSQRPMAEKLFVAARRGVWVLPKYINGQPGDKTPLPTWLPGSIKRRLAKGAVKKLVGEMENYGLPTPDHEPLEAHPTVSSEFLLRCGSGDIAVKPNIRELRGKDVLFEDGSVEQVDAIICATGYKTDFPFLNREDAPVTDNHIGLFKRMVRAERPTLWFMGLAQPLPTLVNLAEQQAKLLSAYLKGDYELPPAAAMTRAIVRDEKRHMGHYYASKRHTMQLDFDLYKKDLKDELKAGAKRAQGRKRAA
ncbi:NAD(P)-binding domain-containing protein [Pacificimonas sp. WHA3]|uniref:Trimethylamine monooxygenase n=1 Tax=Pacificimonas pallii TaxID=2827236 RepID=A0ABS6SBB6_9SPHN|nr:NAD(P)-binding domain-containing protein [Pacificimonas pallii]MBV7255378.1 NAD(P)-binding domain-containing protein [Pacificimonas pallii]